MSHNTVLVSHFQSPVKSLRLINLDVLNLNLTFFSHNDLPSIFVFCLLDCSELYLDGPLQESPVLVRPRGGPRRVLEKSSSERSSAVIHRTPPLSPLEYHPVTCHTHCVMFSALGVAELLLTDSYFYFFHALWQAASAETRFQIQWSQLTASCGLSSEAAAAGWAKAFQQSTKVQYWRCVGFNMRFFSPRYVENWEQNLFSHLLCSHLWRRGEARQRTDPVTQLPRWLPVQQSVCVENHSRRGF